MISDFKFRVRRSDIKDARMMIIEDFQQIGDWRDMAQFLENCGQFIGLKDKNGKEIYEGDILKTSNDSICYVVFQDTGFAVKSPGSEAIDWEFSNFYSECEIIGNIIDNPELLSCGEK